jgi:outer membrane protein assembly factor BamB
LYAGESIYVAADGSVRAFAEDGSVRWRTDVPDSRRLDAVVAGGTVYVREYGVYEASPAVHAFDAESGDRLFSRAVDGGTSSLVVTGDTLYVASEVGTVRALQ